MAKYNLTPTQLPLPLEGATIQIPLTQNQITIIDPVDAELAQYKWCAQYCSGYANGGRYMAKRHDSTPQKKGVVYLLHRVILAKIIGRDLTSDERVDHINGDPLDNRRENLRLASHSQNMMNKGKHVNNTSGYKGVNWHKGEQKWHARIQVNGKSIFLGSFASPYEAYMAYCEKATELHGEFARLV